MHHWGPDGSSPGKEDALQKQKGWVTGPGLTGHRGQGTEPRLWLEEGWALEAENGTCVSKSGGKEE